MLARINSQQWLPGELIPNEQDLAGEFGCTRTTVNRALQALAAEGLLERRRKAGTRVVQRTSRDAVFTIPLVRHEIENSGQTYHYLLLNRDISVAPEAIRAAFALASDQPALYIKCLHLGDGEPYQLEDRWINLSAVPKAEAQSFEVVSPNEWLLREVPFSRAEHIFRAAVAATEEQQLLQLKADEPVFVIERKTWLEAQSITSVRLTHPAYRFKLISRDPL